MTPEEAISEIKAILEEATETEDAVCYVTSVDAESLNLAIEALEKKKLKKPIKHEPIDIALFYRCPVCDNCLIYNGPHCIVCGQKLDWSETTITESV